MPALRRLGRPKIGPVPSNSSVAPCVAVREKSLLSSVRKFTLNCSTESQRPNPLADKVTLSDRRRRAFRVTTSSRGEKKSPGV